MPTNSKTTSAAGSDLPLARKAAAWGLAALWGVFVWGLGGDDLSLEGTSRFLEPLFRFLFPWLSEANNEWLQWAVRKTAHVTEYAVLSSLVLRACWIGGRPGGSRAAWLSFAIAAGFAAADETRQSLSTQRLGSVSDVGLDTLGAALGVAVACFVRRHWPRALERLGIPRPVESTAPTDRTD